MLKKNIKTGWQHNTGDRCSRFYWCKFNIGIDEKCSEYSHCRH